MERKTAELNKQLKQRQISPLEWSAKMKIEIRRQNVEKFGTTFLEGLDPLPGQPVEWNKFTN